jgi:hypothetical protein
MSSLYLHPQDVWHCTLKTRPYTLLFVKKCLEIRSSSNERVPVLIFLNDLRSTSRWNVPIWPPCHRPNKSPLSDRHWNLKSLDNCCSHSWYVLLSSLFMGPLSFLLNDFICSFMITRLPSNEGTSQSFFMSYYLSVFTNYLQIYMLCSNKHKVYTI